MFRATRKFQLELANRESRMIVDPYYRYGEVLMIEAVNGILDEATKLAQKLQCENQSWFWEIVSCLIKEKLLIITVKKLHVNTKNGYPYGQSHIENTNALIDTAIQLRKLSFS